MTESFLRIHHSNLKAFAAVEVKTIRFNITFNLFIPTKLPLPEVSQ
jgi:hypothetical protein